MKLNTKMKIFAFLFRENYRHDDHLFSAKPEAGYYGESQSFSILDETDSLKANIRLNQVSGTDPDDQPGSQSDDEQLILAGADTAEIRKQVGGVTSAPAAPSNSAESARRTYIDVSDLHGEW